MLTTIKHSKFKNTGILFELLVRQITADTLSGNSSKAMTLLKTYFSKTELGKEYKLYEALSKASNLSEGKATVLLDTLIETSKKLNKKNLRREKYNLIKEIKQHYNLEEFFKTKLPNYKTQAALSTLIEIYNHEEVVDPNQIVQNKITILENLTNKEVDQSKVKDTLLEEFKGYSKDLRILTYRMLLEKFNGKYQTFNKQQKEILKEYVSAVDSTPRLREYYNTKVKDFNKEITANIKKTTDKVVIIKLQEVQKFLTPLAKTQNITSENIVNLLHYAELVEELTNIHG